MQQLILQKMGMNRRSPLPLRMPRQWIVIEADLSEG